MKTPFNALKESGAPDAVLAALAGVVPVVSLTPWLDISLLGVTLKTAVPWFVTPLAALVFVLLFVPCIPSKMPVSAAERELEHRFYWLREHLLVNPLTMRSARSAKNALDGGGGGTFQAAEDQYRDKHIEPIIRDAAAFTQCLVSVTHLRRLFEQLPNTYRDADPVDTSLAEKLKHAAEKLPSVSDAQRGAAGDTASRHS